VDTVHDTTWRRIDRAHGNLRLGDVLNGMMEFRHHFNGTLATESMLIREVNDTPKEIEQITVFLSRLKPDVSYLAIPVRPPAEKTVRAAGESALNYAYQIMSRRLGNVEFLTGYEGSAFASTGNAEDDLLKITSVHPMREEAVRELIVKTGGEWKVVEDLLKAEKLVKVDYQANRYYISKFPNVTR
jgi:wyosine [tRNA(Phe)-imidazoG37] synthetase (radical SAM superfamily)